MTDLRCPVALARRPDDADGCARPERHGDEIAGDKVSSGRGAVGIGGVDGDGGEDVDDGGGEVTRGPDSSPRL